MQLSRAADYAVRVMLHLAGLPPGTRVRHTELAAALELPPSFLSKVLQRLQHARLIASRRGTGGGFVLASDCEELTVLDVVQSVEGPVCLNLCLVSATACNLRADCVVHPIWRDAQAAMVAVLRSVSIARLAERNAGKTALGGDSKADRSVEEKSHGADLNLDRRVHPYGAGRRAHLHCRLQAGLLPGY